VLQGYGGCDTYTDTYTSTLEMPSNFGYCERDGACLACLSTCAEECGTLGGAPAFVTAVRDVVSGSPLVGLEQVQALTFSLVRLHGQVDCGFALPGDLDAQAALEEEFPLLQGEPYLYANGTLRFHATPRRFGVVPYHVTLTDDGNLSTTKLMCLAVLPVNQPPSFSLRHALVHVIESHDGGAVACDACVGIAYDLDAGPLEQHQTLSFSIAPQEARIPSLPHVRWTGVTEAEISNSGGALQLFEDGASPSIDITTGTLSFRLQAGRYGKVRFAVTLTDSGGVERGGQDSVGLELVLDVLPVNDAPTFVIVPESIYSEETQEQTWRNVELGSSVSMGPWGEDSQSPVFHLERVGGPDGVVVEPVATYGDGQRVLLDFKIAPDRFGDLTFKITVTDDGGRDHGGVDSSIYHFNISVAPVNNGPSFALASDQIFVNRNSACAGLAIHGGRRTQGSGAAVQCSAAWDDMGSAEARLQEMGAGRCDRMGEVRVHEHMGFLSRFSLGAFEDGANGCPGRARNAHCCSQECVNSTADGYMGFPACGCESQAGTFNMTTLDPAAEADLFDVRPRFLFPCGVLYFVLKSDASGSVSYLVSLSDGILTSSTSSFTITVLRANIQPQFDWTIDPLIELMEDSGPYDAQVI
jgi:hypothetical protein